MVQKHKKFGWPTAELFSASQGSAWVIVFLLFLYLALDIFNKETMSLASVALIQGMNLTVADYGLVASSYSPLYALSGILVGFFVVHRISTRTLIAMLVIIWSAAQILAASASSMVGLITANVLLGAGQGPAVPLAFAICQSLFPSERRNLPMACVTLGLYTGGFVAAPLQTYINWTFGWRMSFLLCGCLGACWLLGWMILGKIPSNQAAEAKHSGDLRGSLLGLLGDRTIIGCFIIAFSCFWATSIVGALNPLFLQKALDYSPTAMAWILNTVTIAQVGIFFAVSWLSQLLLKRGRSSRVARGGVAVACMLIAASCIAMENLIDVPSAKIALLGTASGLAMVPIILAPAIVGDVVPPHQRDGLLLIVTSLATLGFAFSPYLTGKLIMSAGPGAGVAAYDHAFLLAAAPILCVGGLLGLSLLRPETSRRKLQLALADPQ